MVRGMWGRALVVACALSIGRADAQEGTVPVTIRSASQQTELQVGAYQGDQPIAWRHGHPVAFRNLCQPLCTTTPCTLQLAPGVFPLCTGQSRVALHHSADVNVPSTGADVSLRAYPAGPYVAGFLLSLTGALLQIAGTGFLGAWRTGLPPSQRFMVTGAVGLGAGGALLAAGIPVAVVYGREGVASMRPPGQLSLGATGMSGTF